LFSDDGRWLATGGGSEDGKVLISDAALRLLSFSSDGRLLASASDDGTICVWTIYNENARSKLFYCNNEAENDIRHPLEEEHWNNGCRLQRFGPHDTDITGAKLFFSDDGAEVSLRTSLKEISWSIEVDRDGEESHSQPNSNSSQASSVTYIQEQERSYFTFTSLGCVPSRDMLWFVRFEGGGQRREVPILLPDMLVDGPIAYCGDRLALSRKDGTILLLDVSQVIPGINLPNYFSRHITHIP